MVPFLHVTTQIEGRPHDDLLKKVGGRGFPTLKFMGPNGKVLGEPSGREVADFEATLVNLMAIKDLETRIAAGEKDLEDDLFLAKMRMGSYTFEDAKANAAKFKTLTPEEKKEVAQLLINLQVNEIMAGVDSMEAAEEATQAFLAMLQKDRIPTGDALGAFWSMLMEHAEANRDVDLFTRSLNGLKEEYGHIEQAKPYFEAKEAALRKMKEEAEAAKEDEGEAEVQS